MNLRSVTLFCSHPCSTAGRRYWCRINAEARPDGVYAVKERRVFLLGRGRHPCVVKVGAKRRYDPPAGKIGVVSCWERSPTKWSSRTTDKASANRKYPVTRGNKCLSVMLEGKILDGDSVRCSA